MLYVALFVIDEPLYPLDDFAGNAALLEMPDGHTMLIDGGGFADNAAFDVGATIVAPLLWKKKIRTVDTLILSQ